MKKILLSTIFSLFLVLPAYSIGVNVGISGTTGVFHATGTETEATEKSTDDATGVVGYGSVFIEKTLGDRLLVGIDYVPDALASETSESIVDDQKGVNDGASTRNTQKVQVDFKDLTTLYLGLNVTDNLYVKAGYVTVDVITNESLGTGSTYKNTDMSGEVFAVGYNKSFDNGMFARVEGSYMDLGSASVTASNTDNKIELKELEGMAGKISIGKSF
jgi:hypothetical protein